MRCTADNKSYESELLLLSPPVICVTFAHCCLLYGNSRRGWQYFFNFFIFLYRCKMSPALCCWNWISQKIIANDKNIEINDMRCFAPLKFSNKVFDAKTMLPAKESGVVKEEVGGRILSGAQLCSPFIARSLPGTSDNDFMTWQEFWLSFCVILMYVSSTPHTHILQVANVARVWHAFVSRFHYHYYIRTYICTACHLMHQLWHIIVTLSRHCHFCCHTHTKTHTREWQQCEHALITVQQCFLTARFWWLLYNTLTLLAQSLCLQLCLVNFCVVVTATVLFDFVITMQFLWQHISYMIFNEIVVVFAIVTDVS